jgi:molybdenum cofactor cytidylyltransferase
MKTSGSLKLRIVVLAAGFSTRLGQPKPLARVRGTSLLRRTLSVIQGLGGDRTCVVVPRATAGLRYETRRFNVVLLANPRRAEGLSSSVRLGIAAKGSWSGTLLLPVDLARLRRRDLEKLIAYWRGHRRHLVARRIGTPQGDTSPGDASPGGTPLILPRWLKAEALVITGDSGLRQLLSRLQGSQQRLIDLPCAQFDVDSPADLTAARRLRTGSSIRPSTRNRPLP